MKNSACHPSTRSARCYPSSARSEESKVSHPQGEQNSDERFFHLPAQGHVAKGVSKVARIVSRSSLSTQAWNLPTEFARDCRGAVIEKNLQTCAQKVFFCCSVLNLFPDPHAVASANSAIYPHRAPKNVGDVLAGFFLQFDYIRL